MRYKIWMFYILNTYCFSLAALRRRSRDIRRCRILMLTDGKPTSNHQRQHIEDDQMQQSSEEVIVFKIHLFNTVLIIVDMHDIDRSLFVMFSFSFTNAFLIKLFDCVPCRFWMQTFSRTKRLVFSSGIA